MVRAPLFVFLFSGRTHMVHLYKTGKFLTMELGYNFLRISVAWNEVMRYEEWGLEGVVLGYIAVPVDLVL